MALADTDVSSPNFEGKTTKGKYHCAFCHKVATQCCKGCSGLIEEEGKSSGTWYCSTDCQKAHWTIHKPLCKDYQERIKIYQAGELLQNVFFKFREHAMDLSVKAVKTIGSNLAFMENDCDHERPINSSLQNLGLTESDKRAIMTYCFCGEALGLMYNIAKQLLDEISTEVKEILFNAKTPERTVTYIDKLGPRDNSSKGKMLHEILLVSRRKGKPYVLDITGAQYGYDLPVVPWDEYLQKRVAKIERTHHFGFNHDLIHSRFQRFWRPQMRHSSVNVSLAQQKHIAMRAQVMDNAVRVWFESGNMRLSELLKKDHRAFQVHSKALILHIDNALRTYNILANGKPPIIKFYGGKGLYANRPGPEQPDPSERLRERELKEAMKEAMGITTLAEEFIAFGGFV